MTKDHNVAVLFSGKSGHFLFAQSHWILMGVHEKNSVILSDHFTNGVQIIGVINIVVAGNLDPVIKDLRVPAKISRMQKKERIRIAFFQNFKPDVFAMRVRSKYNFHIHWETG